MRSPCDGSPRSATCPRHGGAMLRMDGPPYGSSRSHSSPSSGKADVAGVGATPRSPLARKMSATSSAACDTCGGASGRRLDLLHESGEVLRGARDLTDDARGDLRVDGRGVDVLVSEQGLGRLECRRPVPTDGWRTYAAACAASRARRARPPAPPCGTAG